MTIQKRKDNGFYLQEPTRQYRLIRTITFELLAVATLVIIPYGLAKLWYLVAVLASGSLLALLNLKFLIRSSATNFCGHVLIMVTLLTISCTNYLVWGIGNSYSLWFYLVPLLAACLVGKKGFLLYSGLSLFLIIAFGTLSIPPFYNLPLHRVLIIQWVNHLFAYLILATTVLNLLQENKNYESILQDENYLLQIEKNKYQYLARFDHLTNLPNRQYFKQYLQEVIDSLSPEESVTVFFMDLDKLKDINDYYGHEVGDHLLLQSARRLQACFRTDDFVARIGGDEFTAIVLHNKEEKIPQYLAHRIIQAFKQPFVTKNIHYQSAISIGLSTYPQDALNVENLIVKADQAMYREKKTKNSS